jgi:hypothetical protein
MMCGMLKTPSTNWRPQTRRGSVNHAWYASSRGQEWRRLAAVRLAGILLNDEHLATGHCCDDSCNSRKGAGRSSRPERERLPGSPRRTPYNGFTLDFTRYFSPWPADDDTDIEYVYAYLASNLNRWEFTPTEIRDAWVAHINRAIFVSNRKARDLMSRGVLPPMTGSGVANADRLMIDAQLTTEIWGAAFPGMPERALLAADLPVRTSAAG